MTTLRPNSAAPVYLRTCARRKIENIRRHSAARRFAYQATVLGLIFIAIAAGIICYALTMWYK